MDRKKTIFTSIFKSKGDINSYTHQTVSLTYRKETGLTKGEHEFIINECSKLIIDTIVTKNDGFKLPERLGTLLITGSPPLVPIKRDNLYSKDKKIYHRNSNTGGLLFSITYLNKRKSEGRYENCRLFTFRTSVPLRKAIRESIKNNKTSQWTVVTSYLDRYNKNSNDVFMPMGEWLIQKEERSRLYKLNKLKKELNDQERSNIQT